MVQDFLEKVVKGSGWSLELDTNRLCERIDTPGDLRTGEAIAITTNMLVKAGMDYGDHFVLVEVGETIVFNFDSRATLAKVQKIFKGTIVATSRPARRKKGSTQ